jgi:hypothetical protein
MFMYNFAIAYFNQLISKSRRKSQVFKYRRKRFKIAENFKISPNRRKLSKIAENFKKYRRKRTEIAKNIKKYRRKRPEIVEAFPQISQELQQPLKGKRQLN